MGDVVQWTVRDTVQWIVVDVVQWTVIDMRTVGENAVHSPESDSACRLSVEAVLLWIPRRE